MNANGIAAAIFESTRPSEIARIGPQLGIALAAVRVRFTASLSFRVEILTLR
jgi:hypothetical protein